MKVMILRGEEELIRGIKIIAEDDIDEWILDRLWYEGAKVSSYCRYNGINSDINITFVDLIKEEKE